MSSFGGIPLDVNELGIDFLISSSNKCIQGVPGFGFIIARRSELMRCKGVPALFLWTSTTKGNYRKRAWKMALHFSYSCSPRFQTGVGRTSRRRRGRSTLPALLRKSSYISRRDALSRFPNFARRRYSVTDYHFFPLPA